MYLPTAQVEHVSMFDVAENLPAAHGMHELAPAAVPVFVIDPAPHPMHSSTFDAVEYVPAAQAVHVVAPADEPVSVIDPAWHGTQYDFSSSS